MYVVMSLARKNVGDDLIFRRGLGILRHVSSQANLVEGKGWLPLRQSVDKQAQSQLRGIIIPGGPGARARIDSGYPFLKDAQAASIPVYFLGVGARYFPGTLERAHTALDDATQERMRALGEIAPIGVRDYLSLELLRHNSVPAQMNGCPAWYAMDFLDAPVVAPTSIRRVAFTTAADVRFLGQSIAVLRTLRTSLPAARILVGFHRGIGPSADTSASEGRANLQLLEEAKRLGCEHVDLSGSSEKLSAYADCDLHVGYRVHAHIYFLSTHKPSLLIAEDARGAGVLHALGGAGRAGWSDAAEHPALRVVVGRVLPGVLVARDEEISDWLAMTLEREANTGYPQVAAAASVIAHCWQTRMKPFAERIFAE